MEEREEIVGEYITEEREGSGGETSAVAAVQMTLNLFLVSILLFSISFFCKS